HARRLAAPGPAHDRALERDDVVAGVDADVAVLQHVDADEALVHARRDPRVGHHLAGLAEAFLRFLDDELCVLDDGVLGLFDDLCGRDVGGSEGQECERQNHPGGSFHVPNYDLSRERCLSRSAQARPQRSVIVVRPMIAFKHILVATDFSEASDAALAYGRALTRSLGATLHVLHVVGNLTGLVYGAEGYAATLPGIQRELENTARRQL